jgi:hypothetical protein
MVRKIKSKKPKIKRVRRRPKRRLTKKNKPKSKKIMMMFVSDK